MLRPKDNDAASSWLTCCTECAEDRVAQRRGQVQVCQKEVAIEGFPPWIKVPTSATSVMRLPGRRCDLGRKQNDIGQAGKEQPEATMFVATFLASAAPLF